MSQKLCFLLLLAVNCLPSTINQLAAQSSFQFNHLSTVNGLSDPAIRCITQDKFSNIWIGTSNGLNKYNSYDVRFIPLLIKDSISEKENNVRALLTDEAGDVWAAFAKGIFKYDYNTGLFILQKGSNKISTNKMLLSANGNIYLKTSAGPMLFDKHRGLFSYLKENAGADAAFLKLPVNDFCLDKSDNIYLATDTGLIVYSAKTHRAERKLLSAIGNQPVIRVAVDGLTQVWTTYGYNDALLLKSDASFTKQTLYKDFTSQNGLADNRVNSMFTDNKGRLWLTTSRSGLALYNESSGKFSEYMHDPFQASSLSNNLTVTMYQDQQGLLWVGTEVSGVHFFNPDKNFFHSLQPSYNQSPTLPDYWGRALDQDADGNLWLGTASGVSKYNPVLNTYTLIQHTTNQKDLLSFNSVRSVLCDGDWVWIGSASGLNRYNRLTGKIQRFGEKDSLPMSFFWSLVKDQSGNIWIGCRDGLYKYNNSNNRFENLNNTPLQPWIDRNVVCIYEDSRHRLWFAFYSGGLLQFDPATQQTIYFEKKHSDSNALSNDQVTSIAEDSKGTMWFGTLNGLHAYDEKTNSFKRYSDADQSISERTAAVRVDNKNRIWYTGNRGLIMLDSSRKLFTRFTISDGLPTLDFNMQSAGKLKNGEFVYPTLNGFLVFHPDEYSPKLNSPSVYISSFKVFEKEYFTNSNIEQIRNINLRTDENFFTLEMTAVNYSNPGQNWYAYKLKDFDKEWIYTRERRVKYTNVPGGNYVFYYKASTNRNNWNVPENTLTIYIPTVFYKTYWFKLLAAILLLSGIYIFFRYRLSQREKWLSLQQKTYSLQREKALVMYENLKQQLNPHFLFNSLTSLGSLISSNPVQAKEFLERMSKIYRYILKSSDHETVSLADEIKLAEIYTQLQKSRFKNGLQLTIDVPEDDLHRKIAPVTLQNLIENAIKHNIIDESEPLFIHITVEGEWLKVSNNLQKKNFVETSNKKGLASMQSLYHYLTGKQVSITEDDKHFTVKIPLI